MYQILPSNLIYPMMVITLGVISTLALMNFWTMNKALNPSKLSKLKEKQKSKDMFLGLFVSFDPHSSMKLLGISELNWATGLLFLSIYFYSFWIFPSRLSCIKKSFLSGMNQQFSIALKTGKDGTKSFFNTLFIFFLFCNLLGLIPNVFTPTSHITFNLMISVPLWIGFFLYGWATYTNKMFAHLVPLSTPTPLISFMVLIESISTLIRPGTLGIRLMANMVSGHLLLTLMGNSMAMSPLLILMILILVQTMLSLLEVGVSMIQAYVFCMLLTLYSDESDYSKDH